MSTKIKLKMISFLSGKVISKIENLITVMVNGVGYEVTITRSDSDNIELEQEVNIYIHTHVREDQISLFGFLDSDSMALFKKFLSISGIGPKSGMEIASFSSDKIREAIATDDTNFLSRVPGIGKKTASRIILELKNKLPETDLELKSKSNVDEDAVDALMGLGFDKSHILSVLGALDEGGAEMSSEEKIKFFLQNHER